MNYRVATKIHNVFFRVDFIGPGTIEKLKPQSEKHLLKVRLGNLS